MVLFFCFDLVVGLGFVCGCVVVGCDVLFWVYLGFCDCVVVFVWIVDVGVVVLLCFGVWVDVFFVVEGVLSVCIVVCGVIVLVWLVVVGDGFGLFGVFGDFFGGLVLFVVSDFIVV